MITYNNRILNFVSKVVTEKLQDFQSPYSYCGIAPKGSSVDDSVWKISRIEISTSGTTLTKYAYNVTWTGRYSNTYA